jgi:hypothetical protein
MSTETINRNDAAWVDLVTKTYHEVIAGNVDRAIEKMSAIELAKRTREVKTGKSYREHAIETAMLMGGGASVGGKSALFNRLMQGKPALRFEPPTSYSYPWYAVIEEPGPHRVMLGGCSTLGAMLKGTGGAKGKFAIALNQCAWAVQSFNVAATHLLKLQRQLAKTQVADPQDRYSSTHTWSEEFLQEVKATYAKKPQFIVRHGEWPAFRLFVGQDSSEGAHQSVRRYALASALRSAAQMSRVGSVFDLDFLCMNERIGKTISQGVHPQQRLDEARARAQLTRDNALKCNVTLQFSVEETLLGQQQATLQADVARFEADPTGDDWCQVHLDQWLLERVSDDNSVGLHVGTPS